MGRHALLEAPDVSAVTPERDAPDARTEVRTVAEIIAEFRRDQGLPVLPPRRTQADDLVVGPWTTLPVIAEDDTSDDADANDHDDPAGPVDGDDTHGPDTHGPDTGEIAALRVRRAAAWQAALKPVGAPPAPRRRRAASDSNASAVIATLTAELAATHPGLLEGTPHSRRAEPAAKRTAPAGAAPSLRPVRVTGGLRGAALRVPALAHGWHLPTRTPLVLAGAVAVSVVVTDQAGLLSSTEAGAAATAAAQQRDLAETVQAQQDTAAGATDAAASEGARQARARVSRLERSPLPAAAATQAATPTGTAPAGTGTAVAAAPPPDSVMKPGQTVPGDWVRPSATGIYNSCFCARWGTMHEGIDFAAPLGSPILAVGDGVVVQAGPASGFGNWVIIQHANGDMTIYGHMRYFFVKVGQKVKAGQEIALVGAEGQSTGPHLHLGVKIGSTTGHDGTYVDPVPWLKARGIDVGSYNVNG